MASFSALQTVSARGCGSAAAAVAAGELTAGRRSEARRGWLLLKLIKVIFISHFVEISFLVRSKLLQVEATGTCLQIQMHSNHQVLIKYFNSEVLC